MTSTDPQHEPPARNHVLVAGISGTLGGHVARELVERGWTVRGAARSTGEIPSHSDLAASTGVGDIVYGDLRDWNVATSACSGMRAVVFSAGSSGVAASFEDPLADLRGNALPWLSVLQACEPETTVVLFSSQLVYGPSEGRPFLEADPYRPHSPYALHRVLLEEYGRIFADRLRINVVALRLGNVFGEIHDLGYPKAHGVVRSMLRDLSMKGTAYLYGDGRQTVDLLYAGDLAAAVAAVLATKPDGQRFQAYNVGGEVVTIESIALALRRGLGTGHIERIPWSEGMGAAMAKDIHLDDAAFRTTFGWQPVGNVQEALERLAARATAS